MKATRQQVIISSLVLGLATIPHLSYLTFVNLGFIGIALALRLTRLWYLPATTKKILRYLLVLLTVSWVVSHFGGISGQGAGTALLTSMLYLKLFESHTIRDTRFVTLSSLFLGTAALLYNQSLLLNLYVIFLIAFILYALSQLLPYHSDANITLFQKHKPFKSRSAEIKSEFVYLSFALPIAVIMFIVFPRLSSPLWGLPGQSDQNKTGISDTLAPGKISELFLDDTPAFQATFQGKQPDPKTLYWRTLVMRDFDGSQWIRGNVRIRSQWPVNRSPLTTYTITAMPTHSIWLPALDWPVAASATSVYTDSNEVVSRTSLNSIRSYTLQSLTKNRVQKLNKAEIKRLLSLPVDSNPKLQTLAHSWRNLSTQQKINNALSMFHKDFSYTLSPPLLLSDNKMDRFLFDTQQGYCEHFSSSFAMLMRAAGVPAQIVTGYQGGYLNTTGDFIMVRNSDAHAWVEIWDSGEWLRIDPTSAVAPERVEQGAAHTFSSARGWRNWAWIESIRRTQEYAQYMWNRWFINYDQNRRHEITRDQTGQIAYQRFLVGLIPLFIAVFIYYALRLYRTAIKPEYQFKRLKFRLNNMGIAATASTGPQQLMELISQSENIEISAELEDIILAYQQNLYAKNPPTNGREIALRLISLIRKL